jgi:hypothetical protein
MMANRSWVRQRCLTAKKHAAAKATIGRSASRVQEAFIK